ncbi:hypothetical protein HETIRDRAFT_426430 [Heterobasidion irregulare TC 32-1]|uniref:Uncharacterized protein n=1 Tax=Heterobasidion irregulare (strain TC 32-1) TaxID=747525 RepID=W4KCB4_HETIT|nr:uncharacterized protein HETIRDRAFT_426430 [Heterobasidion irregulare TC 32-1]ETW82980.1 hypothetical protein HETIRDRAFT_426430 [Heterobasidion irregulare TC 32-1]
MTLMDDMEGVTVVEEILERHKILPGLPIILDGVLQRCSDLVSSQGKNCTVISGAGNLNESIRILSPQLSEDIALHSVRSLDLTHLEWSFRDAKREDLATIFFQVWLLIIIAALASHVLATAWAGFNVHSYLKVRNEYMEFVVTGACAGVDVLGGWWDDRLRHTVPAIIYQRYARQSFNSVGAPAKINRMHKLYLFFVMTLQLAAFFTIAATGLWINKLTEDAISQAAHHLRLYMAAFIFSVILEVFWVVFGWLSIRREYRPVFWMFLGASIFVTVIWTLMFFSPVYRFVFNTWPFFATMTVTSYIFLVATSVLGALCRLNFGKGLAHYLIVLEALADDNFTPASFTNDPEAAEGNIPRFSVLFDDTISRPKRATLTGMSNLSYSSDKTDAGASFLALDAEKHSSFTISVLHRERLRTPFKVKMDRVAPSEPI